MTSHVNVTLTDEQIDEALRLCDAATPGPWSPSVWIETDGNEWRATGPCHEENAHEHGSEPGRPDEQAAQRDAAFIARARTLLPQALRELKAARAELAKSADILNGFICVEHGQVIADQEWCCPFCGELCLKLVAGEPSNGHDVAVDRNSLRVELERMRTETERLRVLLGEAIRLGRLGRTWKSDLDRLAKEGGVKP